MKAVLAGLALSLCTVVSAHEVGVAHAHSEFALVVLAIVALGALVYALD